MSKRPVCIAIVSDIHCGSTVAMAPPEGVRLDDGGLYEPSKPQLWLWECWEHFWGQVKERAEGCELWVIYNGDLFEGSHHGTTQIISPHPEPQDYLADRVFGVPKSLKPKHTFIVRGTEAHVGPSGATEERFARWVRAEKNPETHRWSWWHLRLEPHGVLCDFQHHGRMGQRPWTRYNVVALLAADIFYQHASRGLRHPDLAFRSHRHVHVDSGKAHPTRVIQTPAWQLKTAHAHKVAAESLGDIGGIILTVKPDGRYDVEDVLYNVAPPEPWTPK